MKQITRKQAIEIYKSKVWKEWSDEEIVKFQLYQDKLAIPFEKVHAAIEKVLHRPVFSHEFAYMERLREEYEGNRKAPTFQEIINLIPKDKQIIFVQT